jgi:hypothetical protein
MKDKTAPLDAILRVRNPTPEQRLLQHARRLEVALEQGNADEGYREFSLMLRLYRDIRDPK